MKGTILDFLKLTRENPDLSQDLIALAARYGFEFSDEVSESELEDVSGGTLSIGKPEDKSEREADQVADRVAQGGPAPEKSP